MFFVNPTTASREIGSPSENMMVVFRHPNAKLKESFIRSFAQALTWTTYVRGSTDAPRYLDCITAVAHLAKRAFQAYVFPEDPKIKITHLRQLPPHMMRHGWKLLRVQPNEIESGDVILVAQRGMQAVSHAAMFITPGQLFHASREEKSGMICSFQQFSVFYEARLPVRNILAQPTEGSPLLKKRGRDSIADTQPISAVVQQALGSITPASTQAKISPVRIFSPRTKDRLSPRGLQYMKARIALNFNTDAFPPAVDVNLPQRHHLRRSASAFDLKGLAEEDPGEPPMVPDEKRVRIHEPNPIKTAL